MSSDASSSLSIRPWLAVTAAIVSLVSSGCAEGQEVRTTRIDTPRGGLETECSVPLVFSKRHGLIAFGCDDGSIPIVGFHGPARTIQDAFVLDAMSVTDTDAGLSALAFRPAGPDGEPASLMSIDLIAGTRSAQDLEGVEDVDALEVNAAGDCLLAARSDRARGADYRITAHNMRGRGSVAEAVRRPPDIQVDVTGNEASSVGSLAHGFSRCMIGPDGKPALLLTRIRPVDGVAEFTLELHTAGAAPRRLYQARAQWAVLPRQAGYRLAIIEGGTGKLGLIDLSGPIPALTWVAFDGHWLHYDPSDGTGVVIRDPGPPGGQGGADSRGPLVAVQCDPLVSEPVCRDAEVLSRSAAEAYPTGIGTAGSGVIMQYSEVTVSPGSTAYRPRMRWLFRDAP